MGRWLGNKYLLSSKRGALGAEESPDGVEVKQGRDAATNRRVTVKVFDRRTALQEVGVSEMVKFEVFTMARTNGHPNVLELLDVLASPTKIFVVMESVSGSGDDLFQAIASKGRLENKWARHYFGQILDAIEHCHVRGVCHRDIKPENILLDQQQNVKLAGFALSGWFDPSLGDNVANLMHAACGSADYTAPEVVQGLGYDGRAADVWSLGVTLYAMLAGFLPFEAESMTDQFEKSQAGEFSFAPEMCASARSLLECLLEPNPRARYTIEQIRFHPWFVEEREAVAPLPVASPLPRIKKGGPHSESRRRRDKPQRSHPLRLRTIRRGLGTVSLTDENNGIRSDGDTPELDDNNNSNNNNNNDSGKDFASGTCDSDDCRDVFRLSTTPGNDKLDWGSGLPSKPGGIPAGFWKFASTGRDRPPQQQQRSHEKSELPRRHQSDRAASPAGEDDFDEDGVSSPYSDENPSEISKNRSITADHSSVSTTRLANKHDEEETGNDGSANVREEIDKLEAKSKVSIVTPDAGTGSRMRTRAVNDPVTVPETNPDVVCFPRWAGFCHIDVSSSCSTPTTPPPIPRYVGREDEEHRTFRPVTPPSASTPPVSTRIRVPGAASSMLFSTPPTRGLRRSGGAPTDSNTDSVSNDRGDANVRSGTAVISSVSASSADNAAVDPDAYGVSKTPDVWQKNSHRLPAVRVPSSLATPPPLRVSNDSSHHHATDASSRDTVQCAWSEADVDEEKDEEAKDGKEARCVKNYETYTPRSRQTAGTTSAGGRSMVTGDNTRNKKECLAIVVGDREEQPLCGETPPTNLKSWPDFCLSGRDKRAALGGGGDGSGAFDGKFAEELLENLYAPGADKAAAANMMAAAARRRPTTVMMLTTTTSSTVSSNGKAGTSSGETDGASPLSTLPPAVPSSFDQAKSGSMSPTPPGARLLFTVPEPDCLALAQHLLKALERLGCACRLCPEPTPTARVRVKACRPVVGKRYASSGSAAAARSPPCGGVRVGHGNVGPPQEGKGEPPIIGVIVSLVDSGAGIRSEGDRCFVGDEESVSSVSKSSKQSNSTDVVITLSTGRSSEFDLLVQELLASDLGRNIFSAPMEKERRERAMRAERKG